MSTPFCFKPDCKFNQYYVDDKIRSIIELMDNDTQKETRRHMLHSGEYVCENCIEQTVT